MRVATVVIEMQIVRDSVLARHPSHAGVDSRRLRCAQQRGKRIRNLVVRIAVVQIEIDVVLQPPSTPSTSPTASTTRHEGSALAEVMNQPDSDLIVVLLQRSHVVEVVDSAGKVRQRNELKQRLRCRINIRNLISWQRLAGCRINELSA